MRFEVKAGGITAIGIGLMLLSGGVFVLGLLAGYDVGRQAQIDTAQLATSYPLTTARSSGAAPNESSTALGNPAVSSTASSAASPPSANPLATAANADDGAGAPGSTRRVGASPAASRNGVRPALASTSNPVKPESASLPADDDSGAVSNPADQNTEGVSSDTSSGTGPEGSSQVASTTPSTRHKSYNIRIQAAMDISGADRMMARLQKLGYSSHLVPTEIDGQRWYKLEVGPYATPDEASDAEAELRQKYDAAYGGVSRGTTRSHSAATSDDYSEE
jgi:septal ring-binding cell division protein DamX